MGERCVKSESSATLFLKGVYPRCRAVGRADAWASQNYRYCDVLSLWVGIIVNDTLALVAARRQYYESCYAECLQTYHCFKDYRNPII